MNEYRPGRFIMLPPIVKNILIINVLFFIATVTVQQVFKFDLVKILGLHYWMAERFNVYQFITYMFMHGDISHIFFNMFALWMFGRVLEEVWGPKKFITYYLITGIGAALIQYMYQYIEIAPVLTEIDNYIKNPSLEELTKFLNSSYFKIYSYDIQNHYQSFVSEYNSVVNDNKIRAIQLSLDFIQTYRQDFLNAQVMIGASGSVFGLLLAFGMLFPNSIIYIYFAFPLKAKYFVILYGIAELIFGVSNQAGDNVAHFAHLGGMVFGFILIKFWNRNRLNRWNP